MNRIANVLAALLVLCAGAPAGATTLLGFNTGQAPFYLLEGTVASPTQPVPLQVILDGPTATDTFISLTSSDPSVILTFSGVVVQSGQFTGTVLLTAVSLGEAII